MAQTASNHALRRERELRGWSQGYVAERIGAPSPSYISRWERGVTIPIPYYREKLCLLFGKDAQELGFVRTQEKAACDEPIFVQVKNATCDETGSVQVPEGIIYHETGLAQLPQEAICDKPKPISATNHPLSIKLEPNQSTPVLQDTVHLFSKKYKSWPVRHKLACLLVMLLTSLVLFTASSTILSRQLVSSALPSTPVIVRTWPQIQFNKSSYVSNPAVATMQYMLEARGYSIGSYGVDSSYGPMTNEAVRAFQKAYRLPQINSVDGLTWERLILPSAEGSSGYQVQALQVQLNRQIGSSLLVDARFGYATEQAVRQFQQISHLPVTGKADLDVWCLLVGGHISKHAR